MDKTARFMMDLIANEVCGKVFDGTQELSVPTDAELTRLYKLSKSHDLAHLVGSALSKNKIPLNAEIKAKFDKQMLLAVYRYEKLQYELNVLREAFNAHEIVFIPLKGSVIRAYYPEPWMRTSCDIDILVDEVEVDRAADILVEKHGYTYEKKSYHDISLMSPGGVHLELHHNLKENKENIDALLSEYRAYIVPENGYEYRFCNEFFLFHQFAHAFYHFLEGGCGVRPFLDIYLLEEKLTFDRAKLEEMLKQTGIEKFAAVVSDLAAVWFGDREHDDLTRQTEKFILSGGVYGNTENAVSVSQQTDNGRLGHILRRLWMPYDMLCVSYPKLKGKRALQPFYEVKRWFKWLDPNVRKRTNNDLEKINSLTSGKKEEVNRLLADLEILSFAAKQ